VIRVNGFSSAAVARVEAKRNRPVMLLDGNELERVLAEPSTLARVLTHKQRQLLIDAQAHFDSEKTTPSVGPLGDSEGWFVWPDGPVNIPGSRLPSGLLHGDEERGKRFSTMPGIRCFPSLNTGIYGHLSISAAP
jgi:hypothetical protein